MEQIFNWWKQILAEILPRLQIPLCSATFLQEH